MTVKKNIPPAIKRFLKINLRAAKDAWSLVRFAKERKEMTNLVIVKTIAQEIKTTSSTLNKIQNLRLAISAINNIEIKPGEVFSFWKLVKDPSEKKGYQKSRSIRNNKLQEDVGGGLCQLSGLVYFLALHAGLKIRERHAHSIDIYTEAERFTPLGSDATVAYGYKDLQFINNLALPVYFTFKLSDDTLTGTICSTSQLPNIFTIGFEYTKQETATLVTTLTCCNGVKNIVAKNKYKKNFL